MPYWTGFQRPRRLVCDLETLTDRYGRFTAQPFERGFGTTIGNSLRRALLAGIEGAAVTAVRIEGVLHEFSPIPGVVEDATDVILNLKRIPFRLHTMSPVTVRLQKGTPGEVYSRDIETPSEVEVLDPDIYIATVAEGGSLNVEMRVKWGRGYVPAERNFDDDLPSGYIPVDSVHSPIRKVNMTVEPARIGQVTEYDKLTLEIWTNGAIKPVDALGLAAKLIKDHLSIFINFEEEEEETLPELVPTAVEPPRIIPEEVLNRPIEELELSVRAFNCLKNAGIHTVRDLIQRTESEMMQVKNFGKKSLNEVKSVLANLKLSLGMKIDEKGQVLP
ncbi:MAG: DNA-directed RNA polymerase subunit alpha [Blastocatellia bacterium]|nr:DNA-directed RNA polymerase subunit alpha [Blastocatellia bacterium]MCS7157516.1 DNA-directed RNA polymerase subunit alpha [Blastocatellia bacterium]MCX7752689.1 DNA-directed RNA polymerase subunit alpha [Blastocatellia bacterium]MDW8168421.1 DNA-directed RNA polymerase subunit alpha [Acidobacteriota bacterium]MDW8255616.1 DNA-directed RNA polymerase subunit alpha [Acidobacteriota bacterium]